MSKLKKGKVLGIAAACLLVASLAGALVAPAILAQEVPSVSIDPEEQDVEALGTFDIDVWVDAAGRGLAGIDVGVQYNSNVMTTTADDVVVYDLVDWTQEMGPNVTEAAGVGEVSYQQVGPANVAGVDASVMTITFTMLAAAAEDVPYPITVSKGDLMDDTPIIFGDTETNDGTVTIPDGLPPEGPSVSIDPETTEVMAGNSFSINVLVDADGNDLTGIDVQVGYDSDAMTTSTGQITGYNLLDAPGWGVIGPAIDTGEVRYILLNIEAQPDVEGLLMAIEFTVDEDAVLDDYALTITRADLLDEDGVKIPDVATNDGTVTVLPSGPVIFDEIFEGTLTQGDSAFICTIPVGASDLAIDLTTAASPGPDLDLELYDGTTLVIGDGGYCSSGSPTTCIYGDDTFGYSGYNGGEESITADGPLGQAYDLEVFAYEAGTYTVTVYYEIPEGVDVTPPEIDIDLTIAALNVGYPITVTVTGTDPGGSGVARVMFMVSSPWLGEWGPGMAAPQVTYEDIIGVVVSFSDVASLTFTPGWAGTYTIDAWAVDNEDNMTPEGNPVTDTFVILE